MAPFCPQYPPRSAVRAGLTRARYLPPLLYAAAAKKPKTVVDVGEPERALRVPLLNPPCLPVPLLWLAQHLS